MSSTAKTIVLIASSDERERNTWAHHLGADTLFATVTAASTQQVNQYLDGASQLPGLIILDMSLVVDDQFAILKTLKQTKSTKKIPIIVLIEMKDTEMLASLYEFQVSTCIIKPASESELKTIIEKTTKFWLVMSAASTIDSRHN